MSNLYIKPNNLICFHLEKVSRPTALNYIELMEKAKTPFITVEKRNDNKFNVIGGFKYVAGIRELNKKVDLYCNVVDSFHSDCERKLAMLQRCLSNNEKIEYKEILIHELIREFKMNERTISQELGLDASKIKKYMYKQIIPKTYFDKANELGIKPLVQAIYLANSFFPFEKQVLTELSLESKFKSKHMTLYKRYRKNYTLFEDITLAKKQVLSAISIETVTYEYWKTIPHPLNYRYSNKVYNENNLIH